jgi:hypothetical protein
VRTALVCTARRAVPCLVDLLQSKPPPRKSSTALFIAFNFTTRPTVRRFLNRLLGLPLAKQNLLFK